MMKQTREDIKFLTKLMTDFASKVNTTLDDHEDRISKLERETAELRSVSNKTAENVAQCCNQVLLQRDQLDKLNRNIEELLHTAVIWEDATRVGLDTKKVRTRMERSGIPSRAALWELRRQGRLIPDCQGKLTRPVRSGSSRPARCKRAIVLQKEV